MIRRGVDGGGGGGGGGFRAVQVTLRKEKNSRLDRKMRKEIQKKDEAAELCNSPVS